MIGSKSIAVVIPAYNEEEHIENTVSGVPDIVDKIYIINDCSTDSTYEIVKKFSKNERIEIINLKKNLGVGGAIISGYKASLKDGYDIAIVLAGDNQMDPKYIPNLVKPISVDVADYTKGNRLTGREGWDGMSKWRLFGNLILHFMNKLISGYWFVSDPQNGYTAISKKALSTLELDKIKKGYIFENDILVKMNENKLKVLSVDIPARYGTEKSKIRYTSFIVTTLLFFISVFPSRIYLKYIRDLSIHGLFFILPIIFVLTLFLNFVVPLGPLNLLLLVGTIVLPIIAIILEVRKEYIQNKTMKENLILRSSS